MTTRPSRVAEKPKQVDYENNILHSAFFSCSILYIFCTIFSGWQIVWLSVCVYRRLSKNMIYIFRADRMSSIFEKKNKRKERCSYEWTKTTNRKRTKRDSKTIWLFVKCLIESDKKRDKQIDCVISFFSGCANILVTQFSDFFAACLCCCQQETLN